MNKQIWYAVYKGDEFIVHGTKEECGRYLKISPSSIQFYTTPTYKKRGAKGDNRLIAIRVESD